MKKPDYRTNPVKNTWAEVISRNKALQIREFDLEFSHLTKMKPEIAILLQELYAATEKAMVSGKVHPVEVIGAFAMQMHALHRQFTDLMIKPFDEKGNEIPENVKLMEPQGN